MFNLPHGHTAEFAAATEAEPDTERVPLPERNWPGEFGEALAWFAAVVREMDIHGTVRPETLAEIRALIARHGARTAALIAAFKEQERAQ